MSIEDYIDLDDDQAKARKERLCYRTFCRKLGTTDAFRQIVEAFHKVVVVLD